MSSKKGKGQSGKIAAKREVPAGEPPKKAAEAPSPAPAKPRVAERIQEKEPGFTVIKVVAGVIILLIVGAGVLNHFYGGGGADRGDKGQDERCANTQECRAGYLCQGYGDDPEKCLKSCEMKNAQSCEPGYRCVDNYRQTGRKKFRDVPVCVPNAKAR